MTEPEVMFQQTQLWPDGDGPYLLRVTIAKVDDSPQPVGFEMWAIEPPSDDKWLRWRVRLPEAAPRVPLTSTAIRVPLVDLAKRAIRKWRQTARDVVTRSEARPGSIPENWIQEASEVISDTPRRGRPEVLGDAHWRKVADIYSEAHNSGESGRMAVSVQLAGGDGTTTDGPYNTAGKWIQKTRTMGYLPKTEQGKAKANPKEEP